MIYIYNEYEAKFGPCEELYDMEVEKKTTIKEIKNILNETFILGDLEALQYFICKGREQEDKEKYNREPIKYYYKYTEQVLLNDNNKTLKY